MAQFLTTLKWISLVLILFPGTHIGDMTAHAENGRNFAGFLSVTDVVGGTEQVTLSLSLEIVNYSGVDVTNATLRLEQGFPMATLYEFPAPIDIAYRSRMIITAPGLVIPRQQYEQWARGILPRFSVMYSDQTGNTRSSGVEVVPMVVIRDTHP